MQIYLLHHSVGFPVQCLLHLHENVGHLWEVDFCSTQNNKTEGRRERVSARVLAGSSSGWIRSLQLFLVTIQLLYHRINHLFDQHLFPRLVLSLCIFTLWQQPPPCRCMSHISPTTPAAAAGLEQRCLVLLTGRA